MKTIKQISRLVKIYYVFAKYGLDQIVVTIPILTPIHFLPLLNPLNWFGQRKLSRGEALREALIELGPVFVKFGQALSTRPDILPKEVAFELAKLQDKVPPFASDRALEIINAAYGKSANEVFAKFDSTPLASASIAQVHAATLITGEEVVVKVLRPNIRDVIERDIGIMKYFARLIDKYWSESKRLKPKEIVAEFEKNLLDELSLQREAANASQLRRNFSNSELLYVPEVYFDYVRANIMVIERIHGVPVTDMDVLKMHRVNIKKLAERGIEIFFTQVFRDSFFHADMHPGNIFVDVSNPDEPKYISIDFGIMGTLSDKDKNYLAYNLHAFFNRDYRSVARLHIESGWVDRNTSVAEFESAIRTVCEPIFEKPLKDISFALIVIQLFQVARRYKMEVQPQLVLLQKTLLAIEGLGRQIYPELDLWATAKPFLEKWLKKQIGPKVFIKELRENLPFFVEQLPHMPRLVHEVLTLSKEQKLASLQAKPMIDEVRNKSRFSALGIGIILTATLTGALSYVGKLNDSNLIAYEVAFGIVGVLLTSINRYSNK